MSDDSPVPGQSSLPEPTPTQLDDVDIQDVLYSAARVAARRKKNREMFNRKRVELLDDLILNLDMLIYAELSTIYYMELVTKLAATACTDFSTAVTSSVSSSEHRCNSYS